MDSVFTGPDGGRLHFALVCLSAWRHSASLLKLYKVHPAHIPELADTNRNWAQKGKFIYFPKYPNWVLPTSEGEQTHPHVNICAVKDVRVLIISCWPHTPYTNSSSGTRVSPGHVAHSGRAWVEEILFHNMSSSLMFRS